MTNCDCSFIMALYFFGLENLQLHVPEIRFQSSGPIESVLPVTVMVSSDFLKSFVKRQNKRNYLNLSTNGINSETPPHTMSCMRSCLSERNSQYYICQIFLQWSAHWSQSHYRPKETIFIRNIKGLPCFTTFWFICWDVNPDLTR